MISIDSYPTSNKSNNNNNNNNNCDSNTNGNPGKKKKGKKKQNCRMEAELKVEMDNNVERVEEEDEDQSTASSIVPNHKQQQNSHQPKQKEQPQQQLLIDNEDDFDHPRSFLLIDENELMQVESADEFAERLGCSCTTLVKVVSIFGSIGHGKSYTLNHTFYGSQEVFETSSSQDSCTIGIWAAYDEKRRVITLDTEGLLGVSANCQRRTRLLLKVLAISDIVIYRTRSERLEDNLFTFLGDASRVYVQHFSKEMKNAFQRLPELNGHSISELGPVVIIFQETRDTEPLKSEGNQTRESIIRSRFKTLGLSIEAFSAIEYVGIQTLVRPTVFDQLKVCIKRHIKNSSSRTPRPMSVVYATLKTLNEKFNGSIEKTVPSMFPNQYLTCPITCLSCNARCTNSMNHHRDGLGHQTDAKCVYQHQFNNHVLYCRACHERGETVFVTPKTCSSNESPWVGLAKYAWAGYVLECPRCGVIHRSRQYWFGNKDNWESTVRTEIKHVWPGELNKMQAAQNAAQRVLDSVSYLTETVTTISAKPTKMVSEWVADQIAPNYWIPNSMILHCALCNAEFGQYDQKHHCRLCGNGLCKTCSSRSRVVAGWGDSQVRVCDRCYERSDSSSGSQPLMDLVSDSPYTCSQQSSRSSSSHLNEIDCSTASACASGVIANGQSGNVAAGVAKAPDSATVTTRKFGEVIQSTIKTVVSTAIDYPLGVIKDSARPDYWLPDADITNCGLCKKEFNEHLTIHHCRRCGGGFCHDCSSRLQPVPERGWNHSVRVCDKCYKHDDLTAINSLPPLPPVLMQNNGSTNDTNGTKRG